MNKEGQEGIWEGGLAKVFLRCGVLGGQKKKGIGMDWIRLDRFIYLVGGLRPLLGSTLSKCVS